MALLFEILFAGSMLTRLRLRVVGTQLELPSGQPAVGWSPARAAGLSQAVGGWMSTPKTVVLEGTV